MYRNLKAEMARKSIMVKDVADCIGASRQCMSAKLNSTGRITLNEALMIRDTFFPEEDIKTLFANY